MTIYDPSGIPKILSGPLVGRCIAAHIGGSIATVDYIANCSNSTALTTGAMTLNTLWAMPFVAPARGGVLDRIACEVTTLVAAQNLRIGLYENKADYRDVYPGALLADSGNISMATTGIKSFGLTQALVPGRIYWVALVTSESTTQRMRGLAVGGVSHFLGMADTATSLLNLGINVAFTFGALPDPFTAGGAYVTAIPVPVLRYRFSS